MYNIYTQYLIYLFSSVEKYFVKEHILIWSIPRIKSDSMLTKKKKKNTQYDCVNTHRLFLYVTHISSY